MHEAVLDIIRIPFTSSGRIAPLSPGKWQTTYPFSTSIVPPSQTNVLLTLTALRGDGAAASIQIPVSVVR